jgi:hypothetical protein
LTQRTREVDVVTTKLAPLFAALPLLLAADLRAQWAERSAFSISGTAGYCTATGGSLFEGADADGALGLEGALRWELRGYLALGAVVQTVSFSFPALPGDPDRRFTSLLLEARYIARAKNVDPFFGLRAGLGFQSVALDDGNETGFVWGGVIGMRYWAGSNVAIELGAGLTVIEFPHYDLFQAGDPEDGNWLSLFAGLTAAFPGRG